MSQIPAVSGVTNPANTVVSPSAASTPTQRDLNHSVANAVKQLNDSGYAGQGREVLFSFDRTTRLPVIKVVDSNTKEVIDQLPPEYVLKLAQTTTGDDTRDSG